jgi:NAD-dependent SIR2 family protein deacetylase
VSKYETFDRNVYILGAGFSASAGAPLIRSFLDEASALWEDPDAPLSALERNAFAEVFAFRREMAQAREKVRIDLDNVEHLFGLIDIAERLSEPGGTARQSILSLIATTLEVTTKNQPLPVIGFQPRDPHSPQFEMLPQAYARGKYSSPPEYRTDIYSHFAALIGGLLDHPEIRKKREDTLITFNYDLVLDRAVEKAGLEVAYRLNLDDSPDTNLAVSIIKLHGAINWAVCDQCGTLKVIPPDSFLTKRVSCPNLNCDSEMSPLLIPPSWNKASSNFIGTKALFSLWNAAAEALSTATRICVIGYSIPETDAFFRYLLTLALSRNHHLSTFLVVDPSSQVDEKFQTLLDPIFLERRYTYFGHEFEQALATAEFYNKLRRGTDATWQMSSYGPIPVHQQF